MDSERFDEQINTSRVNGQIPVHPCCFGFTYINKGLVGVTVNQTYLKPALAIGLSGESYSFVHPEEKLYSQKQFLITFDAGATPWVEIHQYHKV